MAAVIRVKRRLDEEPVEGLLVSCKKPKTTEEEPKEASAVLQFAGTIQSQEDDILKHLKATPSKTEVKENYKKHVLNITEKLRQRKLQEIKESRFKVVNRFRSSLQSDCKENDENYQEYTVYDVEYDENQNASMPTGEPQEEPKYVYDLYYTNSDDLPDMYLEDYVSVCPLNDELIFGSMRDNGIDLCNSDDDSEDSNAENNWRNDYPDESDLGSINEDDMIEAVENMNLSDNLSSDDGEEDFVYTNEDDGDYYNYVDESDEARFGSKYARFKAKHKKQMSEEEENDLYVGDIDAEDSD